MSKKKKEEKEAPAAKDEPRKLFVNEFSISIKGEDRGFKIMPEGF
jgi:hypothetical protein